MYKTSVIRTNANRTNVIRTNVIRMNVNKTSVGRTNVSTSLEKMSIEKGYVGQVSFWQKALCQTYQLLNWSNELNYKSKTNIESAPQHSAK